MDMKAKYISTLKNLKKIGFITPSSNTALEPLTAMMIAPISHRVSIHSTRVPVTTLTLNAKDVNQFQTENMANAAGLLHDAKLDAILWNGTSGSWTGKGFAADKEICSEITKLTGLPASTSSLAQLEVLQKYGIKNFGLAVPYVEEPTQKIIETYKKEGFNVVSQAKLNETINTKIGNTPIEQIKQLLREADSPEAECIVVACTNLPAALVVNEMEQELGKPIFDSVAVTLWKALELVGLQLPIFGWGKLLRDFEVLAKLESIMNDLLKDTSASRTTIRIDIPDKNCHVDMVAAEAVAPGIPGLKVDSSLNQWSLATVQWLEANKQILVQDDCQNAPVPPPKALMNVYGVKAQMLYPLIWQDEVLGWVSVHYIPSVRHWTEADIEAIGAASNRVKKVLEQANWV
jgi:maleate isomerase